MLVGGICSNVLWVLNGLKTCRVYGVVRTEYRERSTDWSITTTLREAFILALSIRPLRQAMTPFDVGRHPRADAGYVSIWQHTLPGPRIHTLPRIASPPHPARIAVRRYPCSLHQDPVRGQAFPSSSTLAESDVGKVFIVLLCLVGWLETGTSLDPSEFSNRNVETRGLHFCV